MMVSTGLTVPVAVTTRVTAPRVTGAVPVAYRRTAGRQPPDDADDRQHASDNRPEISQT